MCCKRKLVKRRIKVPVRTVRQSSLKRTDSSKPQTATSSTKSAVSQTKSKQSVDKAVVIKVVKKIDSGASKEMTMRDKISNTVTGLFKKKKDLEATQEEGFDSDRNRDIVETTNVKCLGNLDEIIKNRKLKIDKEIEEMKSTHEMDDFKPLKPVTDPKLHVKIAEKKCILYETNDEPTLDDELEERIL
ncbi:unnamed protein product [Wuchereria bancrofti]|uniref:Uncharacterized protein n=2 Tax=Wuchereria bancrofti TaxID=6293 RepID=A0A3P7E0S4_WUCBA|nr:unnamed protein product [Wuchereria bancrofti]